jgi:fatty-acyl-CoA synthase
MRGMNGLMMDFPLTLSAIFRRAEAMFCDREIVFRRPDQSLHRYSYAEFAERTRRLVRVLRDLGIRPGDRVATLAWNHGPHLEAYFAIPLAGSILHTLNLRLHPEELAFIVNHANDRAVVVDSLLLPLWECVRPHVNVPVTIVIDATESVRAGDLAYERLLAQSSATDIGPDPYEQTAAAMCYTTGTTGRPKGVLYSHRSLVLHALGICLADSVGLCEHDVVTPVVPMFHANAWGLPHAAIMSGAKLAFPGPHLNPPALLDLYQRERTTLTAGVPTVWLNMLQVLDANPNAYDISSLRMMLVGGAAIPPAIIDGFQKRHGINIVHAWGMTEMAPLGTISRLPAALIESSDDEKLQQRAKQGRPVPFVEIRGRNESGLVPWDGRTMGELEVRGPWVAGAYYNQTDGDDRFTEDGWFKTGDIVTIDGRGTVQLQDRSKDLIKSGGEWISSVALESALMGHPAVAEAAVIPVQHDKWGERPLAAVVLKPGTSATAAELRSFVAGHVPKIWIPDAFEFIDAIPRTSAGKFKKTELRERFKDYRLP